MKKLKREPRFLITLENPGGELDRRTASTEKACQEAVIDIASELAFFSGGDVIRITDRAES